MDTLAERPRRRPAKPMGSPRMGSNPTGVALSFFYFWQFAHSDAGGNIWRQLRPEFRVQQHGFVVVVAWQKQAQGEYMSRCDPVAMMSAWHIDCLGLDPGRRN